MFKNVKFAYPTRVNNLIFNGLNLKIESGKTTALVGPCKFYSYKFLSSSQPSGGGKSMTIGFIKHSKTPSLNR